MSLRKADIRLSIAEQRKSLAPAWVGRASGRIKSLLEDLAEWRAARSVCSYLAVPCEVQTERIVKLCWKLNKRVCVPALRKTAGRYDLAWYAGGALSPGHGSAPEPVEPVWIEEDAPDDARANDKTETHAVDLAIIPGVAFDRSGGRLGHGRGHYDRLLRLGPLRDAFKLGLAFEFQVLNEVPVDAHDVRMDAVITEKAVYRPQEKR